MNPTLTSGNSNMLQHRTLALIDFQESTSDDWRPVNDTVMGGRSQSQMTLTPNGTAVFSGDLSLDGGGFVSVRTFLSTVDLREFEGLEVRARSDGRVYQLRLRMDREFDGVSYRARFVTNSDWVTIKIPFSTLEPTFRGRQVTNAPKIDPSRLHQLSLMLADAQEGRFRLEVDWIRAYR